MVQSVHVFRNKVGSDIGLFLKAVHALSHAQLACARLPARNGPVNEVEFLGLIPKKVVKTNEIARDPTLSQGETV